MTATWKRLRQQHWLVQVLILLVLAWILFNLPLIAPSIVDNAGAATDPDVALTNATIVDENIIDPSILIAPAPSTLVLATIPAGCHGRVWRRQSIVITGTSIAVGWRQTAIDRWCGNTHGQIYDWGTATGYDGQWASSPYCWYDTGHGKAWWTVSKSEAKVWNTGTLKVCGKVSLGKTITPKIFFHAATSTRRYLYWNYGTSTIYH